MEKIVNGGRVNIQCGHRRGACVLVFVRAVKKMRGRESTQVERRRSHLKAMKDLTARDGGNDIVCNKLNYACHLTGSLL